MKMFQCSTGCYNNIVYPFRSVFCASADSELSEESISALSWLMFLNVDRNTQVTEFAWIFFFYPEKTIKEAEFLSHLTLI